MKAAGRSADVVGLAWLLLLAFLLLSPALKDGPGFGPADLGRELSLLEAPGGYAATIVHDDQNADVITQSNAWEVLDWRLVHAGELPLWDGFAGNGMPQLLNFESAPLALPRLVSYLVPLSWAELTAVAAELLIAGTGAYVLARLLRCRPVAAAFAGSTFMLSGPLVGWLGWPVAGVLAWTGWILAGCLFAYARLRPRLVLPLAVAFAVYAGFPEADVLLAGALCVTLGAGLLARAAARRRASLAGAGRIALGTAGGLALSAPLWLPGVGGVRASIQAALPQLPATANALPLKMSALLVAQGYDGLPLTSATAPGSTWFGSGDYFETAAYVGVLGLALALVALVAAWRRPAVAGLGAMAAVSFLVVYAVPLAPLQHVLTWIGFDGQPLARALPLLSFALALLSGLGLELLLGHWRERHAQVALRISVLLLSALVALLWIGALGTPAIPAGTAQRPVELSGAGVRARSLWWPTAETALAVVATALIAAASRRPAGERLPGRAGPMARAAAPLALAAQSAALLFAGVGINSFGQTLYPVTPAVRELESLAAGSLVGLDAPFVPCNALAAGGGCGLRFWNGIGLYPEMNVAYGVDELVLHDPLVPRAYIEAWPQAGSDSLAPGQNLFVPVVGSVATARRYGVGVVLVSPGMAVPAGMRAVARLRTPSGPSVVVARVPDAPRFSFAAPGASVLAASHPGDAHYVVAVSVDGPGPHRLVARVTDVAGWHAFGESGRPLALGRAPGDLISVEVPAGTREVTLLYRPALLEAGFDLAAAALAVLLAAEVAGYHPALLRRRARPCWRIRRCAPPSSS